MCVLFSVHVCWAGTPPDCHFWLALDLYLRKLCLVGTEASSYIDLARPLQGDARHMAHEVEELLKDILGRAKGGTKVAVDQAGWVASTS